MHHVSSARKRHGEEMPRYTALSTAEELAASCQPRRHAPQAGGLLPRLFGHLLFCYTCVMSTLLCPLLAVVVLAVKAAAFPTAAAASPAHAPIGFRTGGR